MQKSLIDYPTPCVQHASLCNILSLIFNFCLTSTLSLDNSLQHMVSSTQQLEQEQKLVQCNMAAALQTNGTARPRKDDLPREHIDQF